MRDTLALHQTAKALVAPGKGILAADESFANIAEKFEELGIPLSEENRRSYRELLFTTPGIGQYLSGVILFDETIHERAHDGRLFVDVLQEAGIIPGIKVDEGTTPFGTSKETITKGIEGLPSRLPEYVKLGARFAKWRAVITIGPGMPTEEAIEENAKILASYASLCQDVGLVPIVEPEVLMDWSNTIDVCRDATERTLKAVFDALKQAGVSIEGMLLKSNMILPGKESGEKATSEEAAQATIDLFTKILPDSLPGIVFLSGGQSDIEATENLNAMNQSAHPWPLSFSYSRALESSALKTWGGKVENVSAAQAVFAKRAKMNSLAAEGMYQGEAN